jgi:hypothetical protein
LEDFFNKKIIEGNEGNLKINIIINNILKWYLIIYFYYLNYLKNFLNKIEKTSCLIKINIITKKIGNKGLCLYTCVGLNFVFIFYSLHF